jgi:hypothetical protein
MNLLPELSEVDNSFTRCYALQIIYRSKNQGSPSFSVVDKIVIL